VAEIRFVDATRLYRGMWKPAVDAVNLEILDGELTVVAGPSGSGKSTLLRMLAGLEPIDRGGLLIDGADVSRLPPDKRGVSMIFQGFALFPHLTVFDNIAIPLTMRKVSARAVRSRVEQAAEQCGVTGHLTARPDELDHDLRQRVTIARAIVNKPRVVCLDEPLAGSGVPFVMRASTPIAALQRELGITMLYATCSTTDAWVFADQVAMLDRGTLQQTGPPATVFERPETVAVAQFVGSPPMNLVEAPVEEETALFGGQRIEIGPKQREALTGDRVVIGLRPEDLVIAAGGGDAGVRAAAVLVKDTGRDYLTHARAELDGRSIEFVVRHADGPVPERGEQLVLAAVTDRAHLFDARTGRRLPD
jgi:multiple sugar transport system ATP-binding protein